MKGFKETAEINYSAKDIFKIFKKMIKQDFPRFNEKEAIGTSTKKTIGHYTTKSAEAYVEISDYKENAVYEITTITSKTQTTFVSRYELEVIDENTTLLSLNEYQIGEGFFVAVNTFVQTMFFKNRFKTRFSYLKQGLEAALVEEKERTTPKTKGENALDSSTPLDEVAINQNDDNDISIEIKEKENIVE
ncbi:DUF3284 domain-containing protein [uncultured Clostridium sp.]|uniref:DUF3284 domain-containing protein n=1 Tax=uncultured Clostridium sp. TaxID=59620 RepID=UPI0026128A0A|nr:DUF3284 domain-containing protein [uncultured Clostridium sp.]